MAKRRPGRPPAGLKAGEKVKDYKQFNLRLPEEAIAKVNALAFMLKQPAWRIVIEAIDGKAEQLPGLERELFNGLTHQIVLNRMKKRQSAKL